MAESTPEIYEGGPEQFARLREIEIESDDLYLEVGIGPFVQDESENLLSESILVLVAGRPPVGFICLILVDDEPFVVQLSVAASARRQGVGSALMRRSVAWARDQGYEAISLTTYRDVAWNAPFYRSFGFVDVETLTPGLAAMREHERSVGDDDFGARVAMRLSL